MRDVVKQSVKRKQNSKRQRRRSRGQSSYFLLVVFLVVILGMALSMTLFFNITDIVVLDQTGTPEEQVVEMSGIHYHDNLVRLDGAIAEQRIMASIAYAKEVTIKKKFPSTVEIIIEKAEPVANISQSYGYFLVSATNRVLEELRDAPRAGLIVVYGYNPAEGKVGMYLKSEDEKRDNVLRTLTSAVAECQNEMIWSLDMTDQSDIQVQFGENVVFHMGNSSDAVYKLRLAAKTIEQLNAGKRYKLTMIGNNQISVVPAAAPVEAETEPEPMAETME